MGSDKYLLLPCVLQSQNIAFFAIMLICDSNVNKTSFHLTELN